MTTESGHGRQPGECLDAVLAEHAPGRRRIVVAFSGGPDSTLLLHLLAERLPGRRLLAVHVDHGWHADAEHWAEHCRTVARGLGVRCEVVRVDAVARDGRGPEAAAREARYAALADRLGPGDVLLTAHHRDDQAETLLLALLRGGGVHGWASMPVARPFGDGFHLRPWLELPRAALATESERRGLAVLSDPANVDPAYDRVWLRERVLPLLRERHPEVNATLARAAGQAAAAADGVDALAAHDFVPCRGRHDDTLDCRALAALPAARQRALLRWWLHRNGLPRPPSRRLETLRHQLLEAAADRNPRVAWPGAEVRRWRGEVWALAPRTPVDPARTYRWSDRGQALDLPHLRLLPSDLDPFEIGPGREVTIAFRRGGERLPRPGGGTVALKRWLADAGVPPWERDRVPLVYVDDRLVGAIVGAIIGKAVDRR